MQVQMERNIDILIKNLVQVDHQARNVRFNFINGGNNGNAITGNWDHLACNKQWLC